MRKTRFPLTALAPLLLLVACGNPGTPGGSGGPAAESDAVTRRYGTLEFTPCTLQGTSAAGNLEAQCAQLEVPENPQAPQGRTIALNVAWLPAARNAAGTGDPVFFLAGGPGQAATDVASAVDAALREVRKQRHIILVDQRGTGQSNPLNCVDADGEELPFDALQAPTVEAIQDYARRCAQGLKGRADPRFYTTTHAVRDLDAVRQALGVDKINLVGGSYGTRVAQQYASTYPQHTRTVVLDGVAPNDLVVGGEFASTFEDALALQSAQCARLPACSTRYPTDMREQLRAVSARLEAEPVEVQYRDATSGQSTRDTVTDDTLVGLAFAFSYAPQTASLLPLVLDEAAQGRYAPLMSLAQLMTESMGGSMNRGMQWSVICAEDADRFDPATTPEDTLLGDEVARMFFAACPVWPTGARPAGFNAPFKSELPVLLLSGELDPVTPPRYGERVLAGTPNGRHLTLKGQGHGVMGLGCMPKLLGKFIESADAKALETECLDTLTYVPPFTSFNGWEP